MADGRIAVLEKHRKTFTPEQARKAQQRSVEARLERLALISGEDELVSYIEQKCGLKQGTICTPSEDQITSMRGRLNAMPSDALRQIGDDDRLPYWISTLARNMVKERNDGSAQAIESYLDRTYGKPTQKVLAAVKSTDLDFFVNEK